MRVSHLLFCASLPPLTLATQELTKLDEEVDEVAARIFPLLPPYADTDLAANFNKLKSPGDAAYFVVRDTVVVSRKKFWGCPKFGELIPTIP